MAGASPGVHPVVFFPVVGSMVTSPKLGFETVQSLCELGLIGVTGVGIKSPSYPDEMSAHDRISQITESLVSWASARERKFYCYRHVNFSESAPGRLII